MTDIKVRVTHIGVETPHIRTLRLVREDGRRFEPYRAGAHIDVVGPTGVLRQYSLCSPPAESDSQLIAVKLEPDSRGGSAALHQVGEGDVLAIGEPRNLVAVVEGADQHLLVAGGVGITPMLSLAYELHERGEEFRLVYFARSREHGAFVDLLEVADFAARVEIHLGVPRGDQRTLLREALETTTASSHVYTCGPTGFMEQVTAVAAPVVGERNVHVEHFEAAEIDTSEDDSFTVELDTGESFEIPADRSILSVLTDNGIDVFKSCEEGICGSCVSGVLEGVPDHRDNCLSAADKQAGDQMALCVSRAKSPKLVIELY